MCHWFTPRPVLSRCGCKKPIVLTWLALLRSRLTRLTSTSLWLLSWSSWRSPSRSLSPSLPSFTASKHFLLSDCLWCSGLRAERLENVCLCVCVCVCAQTCERLCVCKCMCGHEYGRRGQHKTHKLRLWHNIVTERTQTVTAARHKSAILTTARWIGVRKVTQQWHEILFTFPGQ